MKQVTVRAVPVLPLYQVLHKPLSFEEVNLIVGPTLVKPQQVIEIFFNVDGLGPAAAVGIFQGCTKTPMQHLFTRCDYHQPSGHFIAIEELEVERMNTLFPDRFARVYGVFETPYS